MRGKSNFKISRNWALETQSIVARKASERHERDECFQESDETLSDYELDSPQETNVDLNKEEMGFSPDNDTPESLEQENSTNMDSLERNNLDEHDEIPSNFLEKTIVKAVVKAMQINLLLKRRMKQKMDPLTILSFDSK